MDTDRAYLSNDKDMIKFQSARKLFDSRSVFVRTFYVCEGMG